jgi:hypothetical protein
MKVYKYTGGRRVKNRGMGSKHLGMGSAFGGQFHYTQARKPEGRPTQQTKLACFGSLWVLVHVSDNDKQKKIGGSSSGHLFELENNAQEAVDEILVIRERTIFGYKTFTGTTGQ